MCIFVTGDSDQYYTVDITGFTNAAFIKELMFSKVRTNVVILPISLLSDFSLFSSESQTKNNHNIQCIEHKSTRTRLEKRSWTRLCITFVETKETLSVRSSFLSRTQLRLFMRIHTHPRLHRPPQVPYPHQYCSPSLLHILRCIHGDAHRHVTRALPPRVNATVQSSRTATTPLFPMTWTMARSRANARPCDRRRS